MLEKPNIQDERIITCLQDEYRLCSPQITFLPLGADQNTAVYRVAADDTKPYFLKLRSGVFDPTSVTLPKFYSEQGIGHLIVPLTTPSGQLWANLDAFKTILYPFVEGHDGYDVALSERQWYDFGATLKSIHSADVPPDLRQHIRRETFTPQWRESVRMCLARVESDRFDDPVAVKAAAFMRAKRVEVLDLVKRAARLAQTLQAQPLEFIVCHSDIHAGNILVDATGEAFYIIDWDDPILAPKERDLMYIGGAQGFVGHTPQEEETLFYRGYEQTQINPAALAYYRYERIVQDIAIYCKQLLLTTEGGEDREQSLHYLMSNFFPNGVIEIAYQADQT